jgi:hypothetical protein
MEDLEVTHAENNEIEKKRGFWLSSFLVLMFIANPFTSYTYVSNPESITSLFPNNFMGHPPANNFMGHPPAKKS